MTENLWDGRLRKLRGIVVVVIIFAAVVLMAAPWFLAPRYKDDARAHVYRVLITKAYFDASEEAHPAYGAFLKQDRYTYYTDVYEVLELKPGEYSKFDYPIVVTTQNPREFQRSDDGNYYLVPRNGNNSKGRILVNYRPSDNLDITVVRQADDKIVFNSTKWLQDFRRRTQGRS